MLKRKNNEIEIWSDVIGKGNAQKCFISAILSLFILTFCVFLMKLDFSIPETYIFVGFFIGFPCLVMVLAGIIYLYREKNIPSIILKINREFIEIYGKKYVKIELKKIDKINSVISEYGNFIVIFYKENDKKKKYSFEISPANRGIFNTAIMEYNKNIVIEEKSIR